MCKEKYYNVKNMYVLLLNLNKKLYIGFKMINNFQINVKV